MLSKACSKIPGFIYLALGDPLQKRNYYRAGWLRFQDDADMSAVMSELSEKKVCVFSYTNYMAETQHCNQIEGFKLHVTHNLRPFVNKIRYAPEVASRPDRLAKDLENAKVLATILEDQAAKLRAAKIVPLKAPAVKQDGEGVKAEGSDADMTAPEDEDPEPKEPGSNAVERRIEKVMSDMRDQGLVDINDERVYEEKKVRLSSSRYILHNSRIN